jgi:rare lipoprotein A (peptidoglycan hydrolase)
MNQNRWTRLATVILTTVIGPIANVHANTLPSASVESVDSYILGSPQSLPTITPLVVTELETDVVLPIKPIAVPVVSKLPIIKPYRQITVARSKQQIAKHNRHKQQFAKLPVLTPVFSTNTRVKPTFPVVAIVAPVQPLPIVAPQTPTFITPANTAAKIGTKVDTLHAESLPQVSVIANSPKEDRLDVPAFATGVPAFGITNEQPTQIVNTVIAQVGNTIVAPEPSIAIPVEVSKPSTTPAKLPVSTIPSSTAPASTVPSSTAPSSIPSSTTPVVKIEQPATIIKPTLDKIVATQSGKASWYGIEGGPKTANGERYNPNGLTAAHRTLPFGTKVRVTSIKTGKVVTVRINDRGPFHSRRIIDVSAGAAKVIGIKDDGIGDVRLEVLGRDG